MNALALGAEFNRVRDIILVTETWKDHVTLALRLNRRHKAALFVTLVAAGTGLVSGDTIKTTLGVVLLGMAFAWAFGSDSRVVHRLFLACGLLIVIGTLMYVWHFHREKARLYRDQVTEFERRIPDFAKSYSLLPDPLPPVSSGPVSGTITVPVSQLKHSRDDKNSRSSVPIGQVEEKQPDGSSRYYFIDPTHNYSPPAGLRLTRAQLVRVIRTKEPLNPTSDNGLLVTDEELVIQFLLMYPHWRPALVEDGAPGDSQSKWYADAVAAGVDMTAVPDLEKPGEPPEPFKLWQSVGNEWVLMVPGVFLFFVGVGLLFGVKPARN
jgi:hypothetical protein